MIGEVEIAAKISFSHQILYRFRTKNFVNKSKFSHQILYENCAPLLRSGFPINVTPNSADSVLYDNQPNREDGIKFGARTLIYWQNFGAKTSSCCTKTI